MAPAMKASKAPERAMSKSGIAEALAAAKELKKSHYAKASDSLAALAIEEVEGTGKFTLPVLCMI